MKHHHQVKMLLGLPTLSRGALLEKAGELSAPILISANCLSKWKEIDGDRRWQGFNTRSLENARGREVHLDSAGFVAMHRYGGFPWTVEDYGDLVRRASDPPAERQLLFPGKSSLKSVPLPCDVLRSEFSGQSE